MGDGSGYGGGHPYSVEEHSNLPVHVARCEERYRTLFNRLNRIEIIMLTVAAKVFLLLVGVAAFLLRAKLGW